MSDVVVPLVMMVVFAGGMGALVWLTVVRARRAQRAVLDLLARDRDVEAIAVGSMRWQLATRPPRPRLTLVDAAASTREPARWDVRGVVGAAVPALTLRREGLEGALRESLGLRDVHTGNAAVDRALCIRGRDEEAIRALLSRPEVGDAALEVFRSAALSLEVDKDGALRVRVGRRGRRDGPLTPAQLAEEARRALLAVARFVEAVDAAAGALPRGSLGAANSAATGAVSDSGAPVGVPLVERRERR